MQTSTVTPINDHSKVGDLVSWYNEHDQITRTGIIQSYEWSSFFAATVYFVQESNTGKIARVLVIRQLDRNEY